MSISPVLAEAVRAMTDPDHRCLFDVTLICTSDDNQAEYWMKRLSEGVCRKVSGDESSIYPLVLAVSEDWSKGGAGNGLGTLYAFKKACAKAKEDHGIDLDKQLTEEKISIGLFHTAGKGTRLAPLPASENNNKPGVKLPVCQEMRVGGQSVFSPITGKLFRLLRFISEYTLLLDLSDLACDIHLFIQLLPLLCHSIVLEAVVKQTGGKCFFW